LPSIASGAASFRAGWQSLLASLGSSMEGYSPTETNQRKSSVSTSALAAGAELRQGQGIKKGSNKAGTANLSLASAETGSISIRLTAGTTHSTSTKTEEKKSATKPESESVHSKTSSSSGTAAGPATDPLSALPQSVPVAGYSNTTAPVLHFETHAKRSELSASLSTDFASASFNSHRTDADHSEEFAGVRTAGETAKESGNTAKQGQASLVSSMNEPSGATVDATTSPNAKEDAPSPAALRIQDEPVAETTAMERKPAPALAAIPTPTQTLVSSQGSNQTLVQGQSEIPVQSGNLGINSVSASTDGDDLSLQPVATNAAAQSGKLSAVTPIVSKSGSAGGKTSASALLSPARRTGNFDSVEHGSRLIGGQSSGPAVDTSTMARELAGAHGTVSMAGETVIASTAAKTGPDSRETFATLDAEATSGNPTWIHASAQRAEAGYNDPILGWVGVRAGADGSGVHAEVVAGSADAAQALGSHMAGLNAYLAEHHLPVGTLTLTSSESGWTGMSGNKGAGDGMQQGAGQQTGQETEQGTYVGFQSGSSRDSSSQSPATLPELSAFSGGQGGGAQTVGAGGIHISVVA
jgi:hypothetical protein